MRLGTTITDQCCPCWSLIMKATWTMVRTSAGSIPDSYDIYRYLNLVRYSIFDTFVVNVISSTYSGATWNDCAMSIYYFSKTSFVMKHSRFCFLENPIFFLENPILFLENPLFSLQKPILFSKTYEIRGFVLVYYTTFRKHTKSGV